MYHFTFIILQIVYLDAKRIHKVYHIIQTLISVIDFTNVRMENWCLILAVKAHIGHLASAIVIISMVQFVMRKQKDFLNLLPLKSAHPNHMTL